MGETAIQEQDTITCSTYGLAGQPIAVRMTTSPSDPDDGLYLVHTDNSSGSD